MGAFSTNRYVAVLATSMVLALLVSPIASRVALSLGVVGAEVDGRRTPLLGGLAIFIGCATAILAFGAQARGELIGLLVTGVLVVAVGVADDYQSLGVGKLIPELAVAIVLVLAVNRLNITGVAAVDAFASIILVVVLITAVSHTDLANGLASGLVAVSCVGLFVVGVTTHRYAVALGAVAVLGACLGFLPLNFPTGRLFMGHSGNLFLAVALAYLILRLDIVGALWVRLLVPLLLVGVALFDLTLIVTSRLARSVGPFSGVRSDHILPRLTDLGLSSAGATASLWVAQGILAVLAAVIAARELVPPS